MGDEGERLWRSGLAVSPHLRRLAELYPSFADRVQLALQRTNPRIRATMDVLMARAEQLGREPPDQETLSRRYHLTPAEARLATAIAEGMSIADYAERHDVTRRTVRNQLQAVFDKTGVTRQAHLVSLLLGVAGSDGSKKNSAA
jgi:DNA-binding CsgD family transcriptional regulator